MVLVFMLSVVPAIQASSPQLVEDDVAHTIEESPIACAADAKICSDGTAVGRLPPSCEFAPCPDEYSFEVRTDKLEYKAGEEVKVTATFSSSLYDAFAAEVSASVSYPNGLSRSLVLDEGACAISMCLCAECEEGKPCPVCRCPSLCHYEGTMIASETGVYQVTAYLHKPVSSSHSVKFNVIESDTRSVSISLEPGWNLITLGGRGRLDSGTCLGSERYGFVYLNSENQYLTIKESSERYGERWLEDYLAKRSFWTYSYERCSLSLELTESTDFNGLQIDTGWNFLPITGDMRGKSLADIQGDCNFERAHYWNSRKQGWEPLTPSSIFEAGQSYKGFVAKAARSCSLGANIAPPPLPGW